MILYIGEELPITTYSDCRCLWSGALSYDKNRLCDWEASAKFGFHGKVWVFAWRWATERTAHISASERKWDMQCKQTVISSEQEWILIPIEWHRTIYCTISIDSLPMWHCDTPDEIFISSPGFWGCDRVQISSGVGLRWDILALFGSV